MSLEELKALWDKFEVQQAPTGFFSQSIGGMGLAILKSEVASCVLTVLTTNGELSSRMQNVLSNLITNLQTNIKSLPPELQGYLKEMLAVAEVAKKQTRTRDLRQ